MWNLKLPRVQSGCRLLGSVSELDFTKKLPRSIISVAELVSMLLNSFNSITSDPLKIVGSSWTYESGA